MCELKPDRERERERDREREKLLLPLCILHLSVMC
jgi:hypothetical protein